MERVKGIEPSFWDIKSTIEMEHLRAQSPEIAIKELRAALISVQFGSDHVDRCQSPTWSG